MSTYRKSLTAKDQSELIFVEATFWKDAWSGSLNIHLFGGSEPAPSKTFQAIPFQTSWGHEIRPTDKERAYLYKIYGTPEMKTEMDRFLKNLLHSFIVAKGNRITNPDEKNRFIENYLNV